MWTNRADTEKAQILVGAGIAGVLLARVLARTTDSEMLTWVALIVGVPSLVLMCFGVSRFAVTKGRSPAWGFAGVAGYLLLYYVLKPRPPGDDQIQGHRPPPPPPPPGYVPTR